MGAEADIDESVLSFRFFFFDGWSELGFRVASVVDSYMSHNP